ncbi:D-tyrosyl-tRNA(Tyr) deacylase [Aestuariivirga litoralis]|uniref:D-aminoacyl-tRNA deacylase n=1 Tax=Aestuariivirga litoralis TaxID=2650924 RepID=A0A2W2AIQ9_9HYPH|nr:D-aminoacyl-tRNA deacylase [Aestuariivirga litoralis]PZF75161.1 D-tyrosyl-tRNA(Tyr) deacylase [Aestuariivirga litoralis]
MRAVVQRVSEASVTVEAQVTGAIGRGFLVLVCAMAGDSESQAEKLARKIAALRVFKDEAGKMNLPLSSVQGSVLAVSQFTLAAQGMESGNRPGFSRAAPPDVGQRLYDHFCAVLRAEGVTVETGIFAADMKVALVNDGPVTILFDTAG